MHEDHIIALALDVLENAKYRNPMELDKYIRNHMVEERERYYILIDEIQFVSEIQNPYVDDINAKITFIDVILGFMQMKNADVYVTGSNSKMLSSDILTQFRDRGDEIRVYPLSFAEFYDEYEGDKRGAWQDYYTYGGMPFATMLETHEEKSQYLKDLFDRTYIKDVLERHEIKNNTEVLFILLDILASGIGSLTNPTKLSNTFKSERQISIGSETIEKYIGYFEEAFLIEKAVRYDVKGRKYIGTPYKIYFEDIGLRNARLSFRQIEGATKYNYGTYSFNDTFIRISNGLGTHTSDMRLFCPPQFNVFVLRKEEVQDVVKDTPKKDTEKTSKDTKKETTKAKKATNKKEEAKKKVTKKPVAKKVTKAKETKEEKKEEKKNDKK